MPGRSRGKSTLVYSTDDGGRCPQCLRPRRDCVCGADAPRSRGDDTVRLQRQSKGRGGKTVTIVTGLTLPPVELQQLARRLKKHCGVGGALKGDVLELQGDQRATLQALLEKEGFHVKLAGG